MNSLPLFRCTAWCEFLTLYCLLLRSRAPAVRRGPRPDVALEHGWRCAALSRHTERVSLRISLPGGGGHWAQVGMHGHLPFDCLAPRLTSEPLRGIFVLKIWCLVLTGSGAGRRRQLADRLVTSQEGASARPSTPSMMWHHHCPTRCSAAITSATPAPERLFS